MDSLGTGVAYEFGAFRVDAAQRLLRSRADGEPIALTPKVFETLLYLVEHAGQLVEKTTLMKAIWPNVVVEENNLNQNISTLRRVLGESATEHRFIVTVLGRGYRFVAPVTTLASPAGTSLGEDAASPGTWSPVPGHADKAPVTREKPVGQAHRPRLAILPFANLSPDPANAFFTDGLHEEILATLARKAPALEVVSRTTMMGYRPDPKPVRDVAKEVAATHVLEGSVRREGDAVRLTLQLIDAGTDRHLWSSNFDRTLHNALTLQSDVAREVASQLSVQFSAAADGALTRDPDAYDLYLKGLLARQFVSPLAPLEKIREVEELFSRAIERDPSFAAAYAQRASFRSVMYAFNYDVSERQITAIREDVAAALCLAPGDPHVLASDALRWLWVEGDLPRALATFEAAEAAQLRDPMYVAGKFTILLCMGRADEACRVTERLMAVDPGNPLILSSHAGGLTIARRPAEALRTVARALEQFPGNPMFEMLRAQIVYGWTGRTDEWRAALDRAARAVPNVLLVEQHFDCLRVERRYPALRALLDAIDEPSVRVVAGPGASYLFGVGHRPVAQYRGWTALLEDDRVAAARHGEAVLEFVARERVPTRKAWFRHLLQAHGYTLLGQHDRACAATREALELMPRSRDALTWMPVAFDGAAIYAWSGAGDDAVALLEAMITARPGYGPAILVRDPLFCVPLAGNARYQALADRVAAELRAVEL